jgi:hypothetical protein
MKVKELQELLNKENPEARIKVKKNVKKSKKHSN